MSGSGKLPVLAGGRVAGLAPQSLDEAFRLAQALSMAGEMVPADYRNRPEAALAAIVRGAELGLSPMQSLSSIAVIGGRAALFGDALLALVMRHGHHVDVELVGEGDDRKAVATLTRSSGRKVIRSFSVADAKQAKLWGKLSRDGKPTPWVLYPDRMLSARARAFAIRDGAPDCLMGLAIGEEMQDAVAWGPDAAVDVTPEPSAEVDLDDHIRDLRARLRDARSVEELHTAVARIAEPLAQLQDRDRDLHDELVAYIDLRRVELEDEALGGEVAS
jgi:hypothetical protein